MMLAMSLLFAGLTAQNINPGDPIPPDPNIRIGKLENGITYYIKQNKKPEQRIELRLAVNAGSVCETDGQQGLAHFVEHMCFNGTKNFPSNRIIDMLEEMGVKFGEELNAYTSFDQTIYMLKVPSDKMEWTATISPTLPNPISRRICPPAISCFGFSLAISCKTAAIRTNSVST